jgi:hypothetical protein
MTAATAEPAISERTRALIPVHIFGNPAPVPELLELAEPRGIRVLEDAAQAHGAELGGRMTGSLADAAAFSFFPSKNLGGFGDGGALTTSDAGVAESARLLRARGSKDKRTFTEVGYNSRLDELQAAGLRVLLPHLPDWIDARRRAAGAYLEAGLADLVPVQTETPDGRSAWHILATASSERDRIAARLCAASRRLCGPLIGGARALGAARAARRDRADRLTGAADGLQPCERAGRHGRRNPQRVSPANVGAKRVPGTFGGSAPALEQLFIAASRSSRAGTPTITLRADTSWSTTAPAPITASSPISTPGSTTAPPPTRQARRRVGPSGGSPAVCRPMVSSFVSTTAGPRKASSSTTVPAVT